MKTVLGQRFLALISVIWLLDVAILLTIYLAWVAYPLEINWLHILNDVGLSKTELITNYNHLLSYLTNPFHQVLNMPGFSSSADGLKHFADVKGLFHLAQVLFVVLGLPTIYFFVRTWRDKSLFIHQNTYLFAIVFPVFIALVGVAVGFDEFFTLFHQMLFPGDSTWLFNPYTDPVINALPETFFLHCFLVFFVLYELLLATAFGFSRRSLRLRQHR